MKIYHSLFLSKNYFGFALFFHRSIYLFMYLFCLSSFCLPCIFKNYFFFIQHFFLRLAIFLYFIFSLSTALYLLQLVSCCLSISYLSLFKNLPFLSFHFYFFSFQLFLSIFPSFFSFSLFTTLSLSLALPLQHLKFFVNHLLYHYVFPLMVFLLKGMAKFNLDPLPLTRE